MDKARATGGVWATGGPGRTTSCPRNKPATPRVMWPGAITVRGFALIRALSMAKAVTADCTKSRANSRTDRASIADVVSNVHSGSKVGGKSIRPRPRVPPSAVIEVIAVPLGRRPPSPEMEASCFDSWKQLNFSDSTILRTAKIRVGSATAKISRGDQWKGFLSSEVWQVGLSG